ncbi:RNA polymerase sigma factor [Chitinophaga nivalis]|uniref:RNA polymerase sigma-70 factor n=1 Tax=Chitinophaga nivalis TaxID=2991709 RepID=A0ABT3IRD1_9BACT|nr:RNA polymerase sigma-70 factor [Chitinophaga nivalis]MCW3463792.1 RNA polymerase sigma-70 factor [Chitinophaga nivalis]MCW3486518.1 RNA polymerase sigma-70 factor [Chitinophaga nivalis]
MHDMTDKELVTLVHSQPVEAFRFLYDKYWDPLFSMALKRLQDAEEARDVVQEVFVTIWDQRLQLQPRESLLPYLQVILRNRILNLYARNEVKLRYILETQWQAAFAHNNTAQQLTLKELERIIHTAIAGLPPRMQEIFLLNREEHMSPAEIAAHLSLSVQTVKNQLHRATEKMKAEVSAHIDPTLLVLVLPLITAG